MIKMVVTDIDGTIYSPETGISPAVKNCVKKLTENGIYVAIATGRSFSSTKSIADELGIQCPLICYQGGLINSYDGEILDVKYLNEDIAREIVKELRSRNIHMNVYIEDVLFVENDNDYIKNYVGDKFEIIILIACGLFAAVCYLAMQLAAKAPEPREFISSLVSRKSRKKEK